jgi:two-component system, sensor histidine kinase and response regulator
MNAAAELVNGVLVVDDNEQNRALADATLEDEGYRVVLAASGTEALSAFEAQHFDCVLLDVRMPGMDGFEVCRQIRSLPRGASVSIVFLTALRDLDTFEAALAAGGDDFLTKPLRPAELLVRVKAALELRRLDDENRALFQTIREQRDAMMRLQLHKEQLTAFLVHDLKNPVNGLDLHAQLLQRDRTLSESAKNSVRAIRQEAARLAQLISNMLDISKGEAGELTVQKADCPLHALVASIATEFEVRAEAKQVTLAPRLEVEHVSADPGLLRRVLENLLDNAIRHAPEGSVISLVARKVDGVTEFRIADQGSGVPEPLRELVFDRFVQASGHSSQQNSYGLGLAFCKLAVQAHGGTIAVEDGAPGAIFCVRLPNAP